jgi:Txe/YoeB family toxin of Txe-Axe toxin-antitoxin module
MILNDKNIVDSTRVIRNFKSIVNQIKKDNYKIIMRFNKPEIVMVKFKFFEKLMEESNINENLK